MKKSVKAIVLAASFAICANMNAQNVKGYVYDENGTPMEFATVAAIALPDSTVMCGGISDADGLFSIACPDGASLVQVSMIGYRTSTLPLSAFLSPVSVSMVPDAQMLEGATVSVQLPRTEIKGDAVTTNIAGSVLEHSGNALDVLGKIPGMISMNGELEVLGRGKPAYYLNGRKITDTSELRNLMSEDIKSIDVVSNPGSLYGGEVTCVVRIRTVKRQGDGFSFALTSQAKQHIYDCHDFEPSWSVLDLNYRTGGWDFFGKLVYWDQNQYQVSDIYGGTYVNGISQYQDGKIDFMSRMGGMQYEGGANWQINDKHSIGFKIGRDVTNFTNLHTLFDTDVLVNDVVTDHLVSNSDASSPYNNQWRGNLYYDGNVGKWNINFNADFVRGKVRTDTKTEETSWYAPVEISSMSDAYTTLGAGKLVLSCPIGKGMLQFGAEETYVVSGQEYHITKVEIPAANATLTENTIAGFAQYSIALPFGQLSAGLRYEHTDMNYVDLLVAKNSLERHQDNWFPSISFSAAAGPVNLSVSYTGKTVRPDYNMLTNEITYDNRFIYQSGDPKLLNEKRQTLALNANWKWLTLSANYERDDNKFVQWATPYNDEGVVMIKYANLGTPVRNLSFYLTAGPSIGVWYPQFTVGVRKQFLNMTVEDQRAAGGKRELSLDKPLYLAQANNTFRFKHSWLAEINYQYVSPMNQEIYYIYKPLHTLDLCIQKSFFKDDALTLRLSCSDVLNKNITHVLIDYGSYIINQSNDHRSPCIQLRIGYRFNSARSKYKGTGAGQDAKDRM